MRCKNCGHSIRSTTIYDTEEIRKKSPPYIHSRRDKNKDNCCGVVFCSCEYAEKSEECD